jgi:hypothetical protein
MDAFDSASTPEIFHVGIRRGGDPVAALCYGLGFSAARRLPGRFGCFLLDATAVRSSMNELEAPTRRRTSPTSPVSPGLQILCDRNVMTDYPSRLPQRYLDAGQSGTVILHAMHSASDSLAFAVWKEGLLGRSLSLSPHGGIAEDFGNRLEFEEAYWAGEHPVHPMLGPPGGDRYPLPFHPLALGEAALRALVGFVIEGRREPGDVDASAVPVHGFALRDPAGPTREERDAERLALIARMPARRSLYLQPDGSWSETPATKR